jgi:hypothetical protein
MALKTPFLNGISNLLFGRAKRKKQEVLQAERASIREESPGGLSLQLSEEIAPELIREHSATERKRVYSNDVTFWAFLSQVLSFDGSCSRSVAQVQEWMRVLNKPIPSANTASYVAARQRLPESLLHAVHESICAQLDRTLSKDDYWRGFRVKAEDGTSAQMADTEVNQATYPQPSSQAPGCGFPVVQLVGLIDLSHGGLRNFAESTIETGEMRGYDQLEEHLTEGDLLMGDRLYSSYEVVARLKQRVIEFIGRNHQARKADFRRGRKIGPNERIHVWTKPLQQPRQSRLTAEEWSQIPAEIEVRMIRTKGPNREGKQTTRYVITTLLDPEKYPAIEIVSLYLHRWEIELRFRDIKTTMGMEMLRTESPEMVRKEIMMHVIAYNVARLLMLKSAKIHGCNHRRISFKGVIEVLEECRSGFEKQKGKRRLLEKEKDNLLERIAERIVIERPGRNEPRKKKRRPKSYGWLQRPRHTYFEHFRCDIPPMKILDEAA